MVASACAGVLRAVAVGRLSVRVSFFLEASRLCFRAVVHAVLSRLPEEIFGRSGCGRREELGSGGEGGVLTRE